MKVQVEHLDFAYDSAGPMLFRDLSFSVASAETIAIVGPSGSGKSTLLRLLCGLLPTSQGNVFRGRILIDGFDISSDRETWQKVRSEGALGFMFQDTCLLPNMSLEENIHLPLRILRQSAAAPKLVSDYLRVTGLEKDKRKLPEQSSGGMKTRAALARTFVSSPKLLLLDEPFSSLDVVWKAKLYKELSALKTALQSTVILVTHDIFEAIYFSSRIFIVSDLTSNAVDLILSNWNAEHTYDDVIRDHRDDFVQIKQLIEASCSAQTA